MINDVLRSWVVASRIFALASLQVLISTWTINEEPNRPENAASCVVHVQKCQSTLRQKWQGGIFLWCPRPSGITHNRHMGGDLTCQLDCRNVNQMLNTDYKSVQVSNTCRRTSGSSAFRPQSLEIRAVYGDHVYFLLWLFFFDGGRLLLWNLLYETLVFSFILPFSLLSNSQFPEYRST